MPCCSLVPLTPIAVIVIQPTTAIVLFGDAGDDDLKAPLHRYLVAMLTATTIGAIHYIAIATYTGFIQGTQWCHHSFILAFVHHRIQWCRIRQSHIHQTLLSSQV